MRHSQARPLRSRHARREIHRVWWRGGQNSAGHPESANRAIVALDQFSMQDIESTLILSFWPMKSEARIELTHVNVAASDFAGVGELDQVLPEAVARICTADQVLTHLLVA